MRLARLRVGELVVLLGVVGVVVALTLPWYENAEGKLSAWSTFGFGVFLLILAAAVGLVLVVATVTERSTALPVATAVWSVLFGVLAVIACIVRVLERPHDASSLCAGAWVGLAGAVLIYLRMNNAKPCEDMWVERNRYYKLRGYCFQTPRGVAYFKNDGCTSNDQMVSPSVSSTSRNRPSKVSVSPLGRAILSSIALQNES